VHYWDPINVYKRQGGHYVYVIVSGDDTPF